GEPGRGDRVVGHRRELRVAERAGGLHHDHHRDQREEDREPVAGERGAGPPAQPAGERRGGPGGGPFGLLDHQTLLAAVRAKRPCGRTSSTATRIASAASATSSLPRYPLT